MTNNFTATNIFNGSFLFFKLWFIAINDDTSTSSATEGWFFLLKDHLGSSRVVLDETNTAVSNYDYMPYGNIMRSSVNTEIAYQFTGQEPSQKDGGQV